MVLFVVISMTTTIMGPVRMPLTIQLQKRAFDRATDLESDREALRRRAIYKRRPLRKMKAFSL